MPSFYSIKVDTRILQHIKNQILMYGFHFYLFSNPKAGDDKRASSSDLT